MFYIHEFHTLETSHYKLFIDIGYDILLSSCGTNLWRKYTRVRNKSKNINKCLENTWKFYYTLNHLQMMTMN